jgi:hypothetical protein
MVCGVLDAALLKVLSCVVAAGASCCLLVVAQV